MGGIRGCDAEEGA